MSRFIRQTCIAAAAMAVCMEASGAESGVLERGGSRADDFLIRTAHRFSDAWIRCGAEFQMSWYALKDSSRTARRDLEKRGEEVRGRVSDAGQTAEAVRSRLADAAGTLTGKPGNE